MRSPCLVKMLTVHLKDCSIKYSNLYNPFFMDIFVRNKSERKVVRLYVERNETKYER
jgi:hypothetical protein